MSTPIVELIQVAPFAAVTSAPVRLAIVGVNFGAGIARNLTRDNPFITLTSVCDLDAAKAHQLAGELGVPAFDDLDAQLAEPECEAIGLFTGPVGRAPLIRRILRAGKHIMTTKPFELEVAASFDALEAARQGNLVLHLNSPAPVPSEDMAQIHRWITYHDLGRPIAMRAATWCRYHEQANGTWYDDPVRCPAAPIFRLGVYFLNDFAALLGEPTRVHVMQSRVLTGRPTADNAQLSIEYANGALAQVFASFCVHDDAPYRDEVTLNFQRGTIRRWMERGPGTDMSGDRAVVELHRHGEAPLRLETRPGAFAGWYDWRAFHEAIRNPGLVPRQNPEAVLFGVRLLDAMQRSALSGQPEIVSPA